MAPAIRFFCFSKTVFNAVFHIVLMMKGLYTCRAPPSDIQIYQNKWYSTGNMSYVDKIGLNMCISLCQKTTGCNLVNFDRYISNCTLVQTSNEIIKDNMVTSKSTDFVAVINKPTVS